MSSWYRLFLAVGVGSAIGVGCGSFSSTEPVSEPIEAGGLPSVDSGDLADAQDDGGSCQGSTFSDDFERTVLLTKDWEGGTGPGATAELSTDSPHTGSKSVKVVAGGDGGIASLIGRRLSRPLSGHCVEVGVAVRAAPSMSGEVEFLAIDTSSGTKLVAAISQGKITIGERSSGFTPAVEIPISTAWVVLTIQYDTSPMLRVKVDGVEQTIGQAPTSVSGVLTSVTIGAAIVAQTTSATFFLDDFSLR